MNQPTANDLNALTAAVCKLRDGETLTLEKGRVYSVRPEDSLTLDGIYCSNTARKDENPTGRRVSAVYLKDKRNVTIDGNGSTLLVHGKMTPFLFDGCETVTLKNLTVDYARPTMTEFTILSVRDGVCDVRVNPDCRFRVEDDVLYWTGEDDCRGVPYWEHACASRGQFVTAYDPLTRTSRWLGRDALRTERIEQTGKDTLRLTLAPDADHAALQAGLIAQARSIVRDHTGGLFQRCRDLTFENLRIKFMHGLGMVSQFCENVTFRRCDLTPADGRTIASTADFFQFSGCRGTLVIENCRAWGAHDDHVNIHGTHLQVVSAEKNVLTVRFMHPETWGMQAFARGDTVDFIRWDTLRPYGCAAVLDFERLNDTDVRLRLDRDAPDGLIAGKDVVENATWTSDVQIRGCDFGPSWGRGILCTTRGKVVIENNRFHDLRGPALVVEDDCNFWFESGFTRDVTFRKNEVIRCGYGDTDSGAPSIRVSPKVMNEDSREFVHESLTLTENVFRDAPLGRHRIRLEYLARAHISNNTADAPIDVSAYKCGTVGT